MLTFVASYKYVFFKQQGLSVKSSLKMHSMYFTICYYWHTSIPIYFFSPHMQGFYTMLNKSGIVQKLTSKLVDMKRVINRVQCYPNDFVIFRFSLKKWLSNKKFQLSSVIQLQFEFSISSDGHCIKTLQFCMIHTYLNMYNFSKVVK